MITSPGHTASHCVPYVGTMFEENMESSMIRSWLGVFSLVCQGHWLYWPLTLNRNCNSIATLRSGSFLQLKTAVVLVLLNQLWTLNLFSQGQYRGNILVCNHSILWQTWSWCVLILSFIFHQELSGAVRSCHTAADPSPQHPSCGSRIRMAQHLNLTVQ